MVRVIPAPAGQGSLRGIATQLIHTFYMQFNIYHIPKTTLFHCCSLQVNDSAHLVVLNKEEGSGLGFSIAGGVDLEHKAITVS